MFHSFGVIGRVVPIVFLSLLLLTNALAADASDSVAPRIAGTVLAWGCADPNLDYGQCRVPASLSRADPEKSGVIAIQASFEDSIALRKDGSVWVWGCGPTSCHPAVLMRRGVRAIAASFGHILVLTKGGRVVNWGLCGPGPFSALCTVPASAKGGVKAIAAGEYDSLALRNDGSVVAWGCLGNDDYGQCDTPASARHGVTAIAAGVFHSLALKKDGSVIAWGCGRGMDFGQCDVPSSAKSGVMAIATGGYDPGVKGNPISSDYNLALKKDGSVIAWGCGRYDYGQCDVPASARKGVTAIAAGVYHSLALKQEGGARRGYGSVVAWGCGRSATSDVDYGQCHVPAFAKYGGITAIAAGTTHNVVLQG
jgi:alpha-tubulin suppressor-like RCC1 family protein